MARTARAPNFRSLLFLDALCFTLTWLPGVVTIGLTYGVCLVLLKSGGIWLGLLSLPFVVVFTFIATVFGLRLGLPRLEPGAHSSGLNRGFLAWYCHISLGRSARAFGLQPLLQCAYLTRYLYWRALGAKVAFGVHSSFTVELSDAPLVQIGAGTTLADDVRVTAHRFIGSKLFLGPVSIGENCFIGARATVGPRTRIAPGTRVLAAGASVEKGAASS